MTLELVPISLAEARRFVAEHHSHNEPTTGWKFGVGVQLADRLVAVGVAEPPRARLLDPSRRSVEITRVATDRTRMACSMVYGALCRAAKALGYRRAYTYTLEEECAACVRAAGFVYDGTTKPDDDWNKPGRPRRTTNLFGDRLIPTGVKHRWRRDLCAALDTGRNS